MNIYVGNLSYQAKEEDLKTAFEAFGEVVSVKVITDRNTGQSKGFGFVEMKNDQEGQAAIGGMNGKDVKGREIKASEARPQTETRRDSHGPRGGGGGGGKRY